MYVSCRAVDRGEIRGIAPRTQTFVPREIRQNFFSNNKSFYESEKFWLNFLINFTENLDFC